MSLDRSPRAKSFANETNRLAELVALTSWSMARSAAATHQTRFSSVRSMTGCRSNHAISRLFVRSISTVTADHADGDSVAAFTAGGLVFRASHAVRNVGIPFAVFRFVGLSRRHCKINRSSAATSIAWNVSRFSASFAAVSPQAVPSFNPNLKTASSIFETEDEGICFGLASPLASPLTRPIRVGLPPRFPASEHLFRFDSSRTIRRE